MAKKKVTRKNTVGKKLTKKEEVQQEWAGENRGKVLGSFFRQTIAESIKKTGREDMWVCTPEAHLHVGLPYPSFALEYLTACRVFPLGIVTQIVGEYACCKSSFLYEICRWFRSFGGGGIIMENETKFSPILCSSLNRYDPNAVVVKRTKSTEEWQEGIFRWVEAIQKKCTGTLQDPGPGRVIPICFSVDSLAGKLAEESRTKMKASKHAEKGYPVEALLNSRWFKDATTQLDDWPFHLAVINQLSKNMVDGRVDRKKPGGKFLGFQQSIEFEMARTGYLKTAKYRGVKLNITTMKNSLAESQRTIPVEMIWWHSNDEWVDEFGVEREGRRQHTRFDWFGSTVKLLINLMKDGWKKKIKPIVDLEVTKLPSGAYGVYSEKLDIPSKDPVDFTTAGRTIQHREDILESLRDLFGVQPAYIFQPGQEYHQQVASAMNVSREDEKRRNAEVLASKAAESADVRTKWDAIDKGNEDEL